jgi:hypothetical protein
MTKIDNREAQDRIHTTDDEKKRVIDFWDTNIPIPEVGIHDAPTRCYEINLEWAKIVMGLVSWLADVAAWKEAQHENYTAIQEILKFLQGSDCVDCNAVADCLNQNPDWIGFQNITTTAMEQTTQDFLDELSDQFDGTNPNSINAAIPTTAPDATQKNALCYAITAWVELYVEAKKLKIRQAGFLSQSWDAIQQAIIGAYGVLNNVLGFIVPDDLFSCFVSNSEALTALSNTDAIQEVICAIYQELDGIALLETSLEGAINAAIGSLTGTAQDIACLLDNDLNEQHTLNFFFLYGRALDNSLSADCDCELEWCYEWDFTLGDGDWTLFAPYPPAGVYSLGDGWQHTDVSNAGYIYRGVMIRSNVFTNGVYTLTEVEFEADYEFGHVEVHTTPDLYTLIRFYASGDIAAWSGSEASVPSFSGAPVTHSIAPVDGWTGTIGSIAFEIMSSNDNQDPVIASGSVTLKRIRTKGTGTMPPFTGGVVC